MNRQERLLKRILNHLRFYTLLSIMGLIAGAVFVILSGDGDVQIIGMTLALALIPVAVIVGIYNVADRRDWKIYDKESDET